MELPAMDMGGVSDPYVKVSKATQFFHSKDKIRRKSSESPANADHVECVT